MIQRFIQRSAAALVLAGAVPRRPGAADASAPPCPGRRECAAPAAASAVPRQRAGRGHARRPRAGHQERRDQAQPRPARARGRAAVPGQHAGGAVRVDGRGQDVRARLGADQARRQDRLELPVHAARGDGAAPRRRAAHLPRQPEGRRARTGRVLHRQGPARPRLQARRERSSSRRAPTRSTSSCASRIRRPSCSPSSTSRSGSKRRCASVFASSHVGAPRWPLAAACALAVGAAAAADESRPAATHEIKAPHYGDTLFHFFQDHHFTAITTLMVSQHFDARRSTPTRPRCCAAACCCRTACTARPARSSRS
jgi:hypothetical protein